MVKPIVMFEEVHTLMHLWALYWAEAPSPSVVHFEDFIRQKEDKVRADRFCRLYRAIYAIYGSIA